MYELALRSQQGKHQVDFPISRRAKWAVPIWLRRAEEAGDDGRCRLGVDLGARDWAERRTIRPAIAAAAEGAADSHAPGCGQSG